MTDAVAEVPTREATPREREIQRAKTYEFYLDEQAANQKKGQAVQLTQLAQDLSEADKQVLERISEGFTFSWSDRMQEILKQNEKRDRELGLVKKVEELELAGVERLATVATRVLEQYQAQIDSGNKAIADNWAWIYNSKGKAEHNLVGDVHEIRSSLKILIDALQNVKTGRSDVDERGVSPGSILLSELMRKKQRRLTPDEDKLLKDLEEKYGKEESTYQLQEMVIKDVTHAIDELRAVDKNLQDLLSENHGGQASSKESYGKIKDQVKKLGAMQEFGDIHIYSDQKDADGNYVDLEKIVFDNWVTKRSNWFDRYNPKNHETAIILAAEYAGSEKYQPGGDYALYSFKDPEHPDINRIRINLHNIQLYITDRVREYMWFQGPDDKINALEFIRLYETPYKQATLFEYLVYDVHKYKFSRETGRPNMDYYWFFMYMAYHLSAVEKNFNYGTDAHNAVRDQKTWTEFYAGFCTEDKMANSDRGLRMFRSLSRANIQEIMSHGPGSFAAWFAKSFETEAGVDWGQGHVDPQDPKKFIFETTDLGKLGADGELGQAISDITMLYRSIVELSDRSWTLRGNGRKDKKGKDIVGHVDAMEQELVWDEEHGDEYINLRIELDGLSNTKNKEAIRQRTQKQKQLELLDKERGRILSNQNYFFKALGANPEEVKALEAKYKVNEATDPKERTRRANKAFIEAHHNAVTHYLKILGNKYFVNEFNWRGTDNVRRVVAHCEAEGIMILDAISGKPTQGKYLQSVDKGFLLQELEDRGLTPGDNGEENKLAEAVKKFNSGGDEGEFLEALFALPKNRFGKKKLNLYTETGTMAKSAWQGMFRDSVVDYMYEHRYKNKLERVEVQYAEESGRKAPEWMSDAIQNDTSVSGNKFWGRVAHPEAYYTKNMTKLPAGPTDTLPLIRNGQSMWTGVTVDVVFQDIKNPKRQWSETIYYGDFIQRSTNNRRERIIRASFADQSMSVYLKRRVESMQTLWKYRSDTDSWDMFLPGDAVAGFINGDPFVNQEVLEKKMLAARLALSDLLFAGKYPFLYKRLVRDWRGVKVAGKDDLEIRVGTTTAEHNMLGDNVFLMEDTMMSVKDVREHMEEGKWERGQLLEAMTETASIGSALKEQVGDLIYPSVFIHPIRRWNMRGRAKVQQEFQPKLTTDQLNLVRFALTRIPKIVGMDAEKIHVDMETGKIVDDDSGQELSIEDLNKRIREEMVINGERYNDKVFDDMLWKIAGITFGKVVRKELKEDLSYGGGGLFMVLLAAIIGESMKIITKEIK